MPANANRLHLWHDDIRQSVALYNDWFIRYAPETYKREQQAARKVVADILRATDALRHIGAREIMRAPGMVPVLRMCCSPPLAVDRLMGLAGVTKSFIENLEEGKLPARMAAGDQATNCGAVAATIAAMLDTTLFPWVATGETPTPQALEMALSVVADRLAGSVADPLIRNAQERRQLDILGAYLTAKGYQPARLAPGTNLTTMPPGTWGERMVVRGGKNADLDIPIDAIVQPLQPRKLRMPLLIEAKSAGDFTNTNKRWKEEATKMVALRERFGAGVEFVLLLGGYFGEKYLTHEVGAGIDFVWEHRIADFDLIGL
jgi:hypothetical protein